MKVIVKVVMTLGQIPHRIQMDNKIRLVRMFYVIPGTARNLKRSLPPLSRGSG